MTCINSDYDTQCISYGGSSMQNIIVSKWGNSLGVRIPSNVVKTLDIKEGDTLTIKELKDSFNISKKKENTVEDILCSFYNKPIKDILKMNIKDNDSIVDFGDDVGDEIL